MISFAVEPFAAAYEELQPILIRHYHEIALHHDRLPLAPDAAHYERLDQTGGLVVVVARKNGVPIGYVAAIIGNRLHNATVLGALVDTIWIAPEHRNLGVGTALFDFLEDELRRRGAVTLQCHSKVAHPALGALLDMRGYERIEIVHSRFL